MIVCGDAREVLAGMEAESVHACISSPPYWGLRDYSDAVECVFGGDEGCKHEWGIKLPPRRQRKPEDIKSSDTIQAGHKASSPLLPETDLCVKCGAWRGQFGLEPTPEMYVEHTLEFLRAIRRVLRKDGCVFWNLGDSYASQPKGNKEPSGLQTKNYGIGSDVPMKRNVIWSDCDLKPKDLVMIPFRVALAAQADGWWVRSVIVWCLSGGVKLYAQTQKGTMPSTIKDLVRLDPSTVKLWNGEKWTQVVAWHESPRPEAPLEIELRSGEKIGCTGGHVWPTQRGNVRADELQVGDVIESTTLPEPWEPQPSYIPHYLGWFVGLYIAEGSRSGDTIQISSHVDEAEKRAKRLRLWTANAFGGTVRWHKTQGNSAVICIESKIMNAILDMYVAGRTAKDKHLTRAAWHRNDKFLRELLQGYLEGDGHHDKNNNRWRLGFCRNDHWAADLRTICARLGMQLRLKTSQATYQGGTKPSYRGEIRLERPTHLNAKADTEVVGIGRSRARKFWDVEVEDEPHLFTLASGVLTHNSKPNPMPESVRDRPTTSHEYVLLLTKDKKYFYDADAIREQHQSPIHTSPRNTGAEWAKLNHGSFDGEITMHPAGRNKRTVWTIATQPYPEAHFATFPEALVEPMILTTPTKCCAECGAGWERVTEKGLTAHDGATESLYPKGTTANRLALLRQAARERGGEYVRSSNTLGFRPACDCPGLDGDHWGSDCADEDNWPTKPAVILDPFAGRGTVGRKARQHGRDFVMIEMNPDYIPMMERYLALADEEVEKQGETWVQPRMDLTNLLK